jgi:glycosyltransferase involved in cell wall biosynthesis
MIEISVNLATHNRADYLESCLVSLCQQTISPDRYEICVVNNACTDTTPETVEAVAKQYPKHNLFMVCEPVAGLSRARNCGISATTGSLIANIDDDATANPDWLEVFLNRFATLPNNLAAIGGEIDPIWQAPPPPWLEPWMKGLLSAASNLGNQPRFIELPEGLFEGNSCYRRTALFEIGLYPTELGRTGDLLLSGEGVVHSLMRHRGWRLFFDPGAIIHHNIHADRLTPNWFRKRLFWQGISDYATHSYQRRHGLDVVEEMKLDLPLKAEDWDFIVTDTPTNLQKSRMHFQSLGFVLAMTGIIPIRGQ